MNTAPTVMVSSTFYDLQQIRSDLKDFIEGDLGYNALLSELPSFPINPDSDTIENCRSRVEHHADIFVLVIGGRYGSVDSASAKSITNLEFLTARAKGIPIYVFINKSILANLPVWKSNPETDFSAVVDTTKLFEFIELVRDKERVWTFEFETAQDIIESLRVQFSYLFFDALISRNLIIDSGMPQYLEGLKPKTLRIALEKLPAWEYKLFYQCWIDEVERRGGLIREYRLAIRMDNVSFVPAAEASKWLQTQLHELHYLVDSANVLINDSAKEAFGEPGEPGDDEKIVWITRTLGRLLEQMLRWAIRIRCTEFEPPFDIVAPEVALFVDDLVTQFESYPRESLEKIEVALSSPDTGVTKLLTLTMTFTLSNQDRFSQKLDEAMRLFK